MMLEPRVCGMRFNGVLQHIDGRFYSTLFDQDARVFDGISWSAGREEVSRRE
jgi:hypothetical protein